jgi:hypothetical protein
VSGIFSIPTGTAPGTHTVTLVGTDAAGAAKTVELSLVVTASSAAPITTGSTPQTLAFTGSPTRDLASIALLLIAAGLLLLGRRSRRAAPRT